LKLVDGDASNKDKLAEAMAKVQFNAPRGPFRFDPATHNPIQDVYIAQVIEMDGKILLRRSRPPNRCRIRATRSSGRRTDGFVNVRLRAPWSCSSPNC